MEIYDVCLIKDSQLNASTSFYGNCLPFGVHVLQGLLSRAILSRIIL